LYSVIRLALFAALLAVLLAVGIEGWLAAIIAAIVGLCISYLFLGRLRAPVAESVGDRRSGKTKAKSDDEDTEDDAIAQRDWLSRDSLEGDGPGKS
jgi:hypothetical protein